MTDSHIERRIIIGCITSTEYLQQMQTTWDAQLLQSTTAKTMARWAWNHFLKYKEAINKGIESVYRQNLKRLNKADAIDLEELLQGLSEEYEQQSVNVAYLVDQTREYFQHRRLQIHAETIESLLGQDELDAAEQVASEYKPSLVHSITDLDLSTPTVLERIDLAFAEAATPLIQYPRALGEFWNAQMTRGSFVSLMASEKRGKTFWLIDLALRACKQGRNVAFFQAGDMTENQQLKRICVYLTKKSDQQRYAGKMYEPVRDCVYNQLNTCNKEERQSGIGCFSVENRMSEDEIRRVDLKTLIEAAKNYSDYTPCTNCLQGKYTPWMTQVDVGDALTATEAKKAVERFFIKHNRNFKLSTHPNGTLSVRGIQTLLATWERIDNFVPDIVVIDYADLLAAENKVEFRHQQNEIWKALRSLSQEKRCLVLTATQADAKSYESNRLKLSNFSEDKRKYAHVTAMYGLNQDTQDREKQIGIMRINEIVIREGEFSNSNEVTILQNLRRGRPFLSSYR